MNIKNVPFLQHKTELQPEGDRKQCERERDRERVRERKKSFLLFFEFLLTHF